MKIDFAKYKNMSQEERQEEDQRLMNIIMFGTKWQRFKKLFWSIVHNIKGLITYFVVLPVLPIIYIIQAIRGELE